MPTFYPNSEYRTELGEIVSKWIIERYPSKFKHRPQPGVEFNPYQGYDVIIPNDEPTGYKSVMHIGNHYVWLFDQDQDIAYAKVLASDPLFFSSIAQCLEEKW